MDCNLNLVYWLIVRKFNWFMGIKKIWYTFSNLGNSTGNSDLSAKSIVFINRISVIFCLFILTSILINLLLGSYFFIVVLSAALVMILLNFLLNYYGQHLLARINTMITINLLLLYMSFAGGAGSGLEFYFLSLTILPLIIFQSPVYIVIFEALCIASLICQRLYAKPFIPLAAEEQMVFTIFYIINSIYSALLIILGIIFFRSINERNENQLITANKAVEQKNQELEELNKRLESFSSTVSHDLRAPLRGIMTISNIIQEDYGKTLGEEGIKLIEMQLATVKKMDRLIEDLLSFSRVGKKTVDKNEVDMEALANEVVYELLDPEARKEVNVIIHPLPKAKADRTLLKQVLINLLSNALKYSGKVDKPVIEIGSYKEKNEHIFYVKDNGVGFDMSYSTKLFKVFQRLHNSDEFEGTGLGLSIVQTIIHGHGGRVWATGKVNEGAIFYFSLPL